MGVSVDVGVVVGLVEGVPAVEEIGHQYMFSCILLDFTAKVLLLAYTIFEYLSLKYVQIFLFF